MRGAFNKDVLRSVTHSLGRFLAIAAIVALGTGFYAGLRMTAPDMKLAADQFYDGTNLMDIRVVSTLGLTDGDLAALRGVEGVAQVMGAYETDVMATVNDEQYAIRVHSLPAAAAESNTGDGVNAVKAAMNEAIAKGVPAKHRTDNYDDYLNRLTNFDTRKQADAEQIKALFAREVK